MFKQGVAFGAKIGTCICPRYGTMIGGAVGGILATAGSTEAIEITFNPEESDNQETP